MGLWRILAFGIGPGRVGIALRIVVVSLGEGFEVGFDERMGGWKKKMKDRKEKGGKECKCPNLEIGVCSLLLCGVLFEGC